MDVAVLARNDWRELRERGRGRGRRLGRGMARTWHDCSSSGMSATVPVEAETKIYISGISCRND